MNSKLEILVGLRGPIKKDFRIFSMSVSVSVQDTFQIVIKLFIRLANPVGKKCRSNKFNL